MTPDWTNVERVLAVRLDSMGDVLMTGPALRALQQAGKRVTLLTSAEGASAARLLPGLENVVTYSAPWMKSTSKSSAAVDFRTIATLRRKRFDAAVIFTVFSQSPLPAALTCHLAGIPRRLAVCREIPYHLLTDWIKETEPGETIRHEVVRQLDLVRHVGATVHDDRLRVSIPVEARGWVEERLGELGLCDSARWLVLHPGASAPSRRYPPEGFAEVARRLIDDHGFRVFVTAGASERDIAREIEAREPRTETLLDLPNLGALAALLAAAPIVVANNSGPAHLAAAVGTPVVDLYALTNPQHTPWRVSCRVLSHDVPCRYCFKSSCPELHNDCLRKIAPEAVVAAALELFHETHRTEMRPVCTC